MIPFEKTRLILKTTLIKIQIFFYQFFFFQNSINFIRKIFRTTSSSKETFDVKHPVFMCKHQI